jgi:hypothetical protein
MRIEKDWMFDHRQAWDHERDLAALEGRPPVKFFAKQPNIIGHTLIREPSVNSSVPSKEDHSKKYTRNRKR